MKKGFALLETVIVITFLCVSLLLLYNTFTSMIRNREENILYDDASNIYKAHYIKEYLNTDNLNNLLDNSNIKSITCNDFNLNKCNTLLESLDVNKIYITKYNLKEYNQDNYPSYLNNYLNSLSNKEDYKYRFIVEFNNTDTYSYASIGFNGDTYE